MVESKIQIFDLLFSKQMGPDGSIPNHPPTKEDFQKLSEHTRFTPKELEMLYVKFKAVSNSEIADDLIDLDEFEHALGLKKSGFVERIFAAFDKDDSKQIDFYEFATGLSAMSTRASLHEKAGFCFGVYDIDRNGYIDKQELTEVLSFSLGQNSNVKLPPHQLNKIIDVTFKKMDSNGDGQISLEEFEAEAKKNPSILSCVNLSIENIFKS